MPAVTTTPAQPTPEQTERARLDLRSRSATLDRLRSHEYDVLVIGRGVTGGGAALDAALRGLSVALVEKRDWASGTSSRSGKLIHGGLRYLEQLDFALVREALKERALLLKTLCPHLARPIQFIYPLKHRVWERAYMGSGLILYDTIGGAGAVPRHGHLMLSTIKELAPGLNEDELVGGLSFYDVQIDDARHTCELVRTAAAHGADVASALEVTSLLLDGDRVVGARLRDTESPGSAEIEIRAKVVVNATGVWGERIRRMAPGEPTFTVRASKGIHITVPRERIDSTISIFIRAEDSVIFVRTWGDQWLIGTTDTTYSEDLDHPAATATDIDYLLRNVNRVLNEPLSREDITGVYSGLRPLVTAEESVNSKLSREHAVDASAPGLVTIAGGKYTTYRVMAKDVIDEVCQQLGVETECTTEEVPLLGAVGLPAATRTATTTGRALGLSSSYVEHLLQRYGSMTLDVLALVTARPELGRPVPGAPDYLLAEVVYAVTQESALHVDDVLTRRTRIAIETAHRGLDSLEAVADLMAAELGWDADRVAREVRHYRDRVAAERAAEEKPDDASAAAVRNAVRDPRLPALEGAE